MLRDWWRNWKEQADRLRREALVVYLAFRHPRTPWYAKALLFAAAAYAFSPIDLIPDFIPIFGTLDDLVIVPLLIMLAYRLTPKDVTEECRLRAHDVAKQPRFIFMGVLVAVVYVFVAYVAGYCMYRWLWT